MQEGGSVAASLRTKHCKMTSSLVRRCLCLHEFRNSLPVRRQPGRPRIDLPIAAAASVALLPSQVDTQVEPGAAGEPTVVPPVLALNRPTVIQGHGRLTCDDPLTCFSSPDLTLTAAPG